MIGPSDYYFSSGLKTPTSHYINTASHLNVAMLIGRMGQYVS